MPDERSIEDLVEDLAQAAFGVAISTERRTFNEDTLARAERARAALLIADSLIAAAREEGRREGEADLDECNAALDHILGVCRDEGLVGEDAVLMGRAVKSLKAAHAAQLVALRGAALLAYRRAKGALCWEHPARRCENCERELDEFIGPLPDAEAALARVREEAVRETIARVCAKGGWYRDGEMQEGGKMRTYLRIYVADGADLSCPATATDALLNALGVKP